jgi:acetyl/propionyl-CoA carboxylase alpha subunit
MIRALKRTHIAGLSTNRDFLVGLLSSDTFTKNKIHTRLLDLEVQNLLSFIDQQRARHDPGTLLAAACFISLDKAEENGGNTGSPWHQIGHWRILPGITLQSGQQSYFIKYRAEAGNEGMWFRINDQETRVVQEHREGPYYRLRIRGQILELWGTTDRSELHLDVDGQHFAFRRLDVPDRRYIPLNETPKGSAQGEISAPLNGRVVEISVQEGDRVTAGKALVVIESMKMENKMLADHEALVEQIMVSVGQQVRTNQILLTLASI